VTARTPATSSIAWRRAASAAPSWTSCASCSTRCQAGDALALRALAGHPGELDHLLSAARVRRVMAGVQPRTVGFVAHRAADAIGLGRAASASARIGKVLREALGEERGAALARALDDELLAMRRRVRTRVEAEARRDEPPPGTPRPPARDLPFGELTA
jgi:hypothetical protein